MGTGPFYFQNLRVKPREGSFCPQPEEAEGGLSPSHVFSQLEMVSTDTSLSAQINTKVLLLSKGSLTSKRSGGNSLESKQGSRERD